MSDLDRTTGDEHDALLRHLGLNPRLLNTTKRTEREPWFSPELSDLFDRYDEWCENPQSGTTYQWMGKAVGILHALVDLLRKGEQ